MILGINQIETLLLEVDKDLRHIAFDILRLPEQDLREYVLSVFLLDLHKALDPTNNERIEQEAKRVAHLHRLTSQVSHRIIGLIAHTKAAIDLCQRLHLDNGDALEAVRLMSMASVGIGCLLGELRHSKKLDPEQRRLVNKRAGEVSGESRASKAREDYPAIAATYSRYAAINKRTAIKSTAVDHDCSRTKVYSAIKAMKVSLNK